MSLYLGVPFDPLPTLQEDDELVPLSSILTLRRGSLRELEVWAVCRECCLALRSVSKSSLDLFHKLCLTPDTLTFNAAGSVSFSVSDVVDKDYQPPEFYRDGNTFKGHIYSLARTLLEASVHDLPEDISLNISPNLVGFLTRMSLDDPLRRPTLEEVTVTCNRELHNDPGSSKSICRQLSSIARRKLSLESQYEFPISGRSRKSSNETSQLVSIKSDIPEDLQNDNEDSTNKPSNTYDPSTKMKPSNIPGLSRILDKESASSLPNGGKDDLQQSTITDYASKALKELPSPAALNNLSQRAQDILKRLYSAGEQQGYFDKKSWTGAGSKDVPNITVSSSSLMEKTPGPKNKGVPRPEEINERLQDLIKEREGTGNDADIAQGHETLTNEQKIRQILNKIPKSDDDRTKSPGRRESSSPRSISSPGGQKQSNSKPHSYHNSPRNKLSPRDTKPSSHNEVTKQVVSRTRSASPKFISKKGSLRRRLSEKQLVKYIDRRKSSGRNTPDILEELEEENVPDDFMLDDLWSDDDDDDSNPMANGRMAIQRSLSHSGEISAQKSAFQTSAGVNRSTSMKVALLSGGKMQPALSLDNISEEKAERIELEEHVMKAAVRLKQKRSSITAETGLLDNKPNFSDIKELTKVQNQVRRSSLADFRVPSGFGSRATYFTPIVVSDDKPGMTRAASSPTMDNAKAKARAALKAKLDLKILKRGNKPPPSMLEDLENDALINPLPTPRDLEKNMTKALSTNASPLIKRKILTASLPSELDNVPASHHKSLSSISSPRGEPDPSRKTSFASSLSDNVFIEDVLGCNDQDVVKDQRLKDFEGTESETQKSEIAENEMTLLQPKIRTISESPITSQNSFSPIDLPEVKEATGVIRPTTPNSNQNLSSGTNKEHSKPEVTTISKQCESSIQKENLLTNTNCDTIATEPTATSQTNNNAMKCISPSIQVNNKTVVTSTPSIPADQRLMVGHALSPNHLSHTSPTPQVQQVIGQTIPQVIGQMAPSQSIPLVNQQAQFVNQPNVYGPGQMMNPVVNPGASISPVPQVFNPAMMPAFPYHVQLQADPQTGLYRVVPVGLPIQGIPFHGSNGSLSGNSFGSPVTPPQSENNAEVNAPINHLHSYWSRQKGILDTSSDGDSTCIPMSPESLRRAVVDRKKDQVKKRLEKGRNGTPPSKRSNAKTSASSLIRNPTDSESSESCAFAKPKDLRKLSPQVPKKKHSKGSLSDGDRKDRVKERIRERNDKLKRDTDMSRSRSCDRLRASPQNQRRSSVSKSDMSEKSHEDLSIQHTEMKLSKLALTKSANRNDDIDDSRPVELPPATASPASVSSVSHDSGVNMRFSMSSGEDMSQVVASQLADAMQGHTVVRKVMKLIRHAFAFDGYMENGVEDKEMAEYIKSLGKLSWTTFSSAVTEKFCDLFWEEDLLEMLYETINGEKPTKPQQQPQKPTGAHIRRSKPSSKSTSKSHTSKSKLQKPKSSSKPKHPEDEDILSDLLPDDSFTSTSSVSRTKSPKPKSTSTPDSKHPEEDDVLSDLLPDDAFTSTSSRHSRSTVKSNVVKDAKLATDEKGRSHSRDSSSGSKSSRESKKSQSRDKSRSASRDRSKSRAEGKERTPRKDDKKNIVKVDTELDDKKTAPVKPKRNPSPGIEPVPKPRSRKHDGKSSDAKPTPRKRTQSQDQKEIKQNKERERTKRQSDVSDSDDLMLTGLPAVNQSVNLKQPNRTGNTETNPKDLLTKTQSRESLSSNWSDSQFNSMNNSSKSRESLDLNLSQSFTSGNLSDNQNSFLNESSSSFETPLSTSRYTPSSNKLSNNSPRRIHQQNSDSSDTNSPAVKDRISTLLQNALSRRDSTVSVSSASSSGTSHFFKSSSPDENLSLSGSFSTEDSRPGFPNSVTYSSDGGIDPRIAAYTQQLTGAGETQNSIESKIADVEQQLMMERRMRNKTDKFYLKLVDAQYSKGADHKAMLVKVGKQLSEMSTKIEFLESAKRHLEMLYAEQWGLDFSLLYSFATSAGSEPLQLKQGDDNHLVSFHMGRNKHTLQAGEPLGLFSYLFARQALLDGYLHHFFYTYHYFAKSEELLKFIQDKFIAASGMYETSQQENRSKILCRAVDILQVWVEGFYEVDFRHNSSLLEQLIIFTTEKIIPVDPQGQNLLQLLDKFQREKASIGGTGWPNVCRKPSFSSPQASPIKDSLSSLSPSRLRINQDSNRSLKMNIKACFTRKESSKRSSEPTYLPASSMDKDGFSLSEHTSLTLAQQLTLIQQELFQRVHPVHYLNSRCKGIGVSTNNNSATTAQSGVALVRNGVFENGEGSGELLNNLFVQQVGDDGIVKLLLDHARGMSHWVSAEIVTCSSSKTQMALLSKFINTAKSCYDTRNFATCVQIMDGLENLIVRQVPAWRILPSKVGSVYEELSNSRVQLQGDSDTLVKGEGHRKQPTIPPTLLFLMHVQQLEIGGFQLANGLYKWTKIKSIAKLIDHIRLFQDNLYDYEPDTTFQDLLKQKVAGFNNVDVQILAAQNSSNFHQLSSNKGGKRISNAFQKMKANLQH